MLTNMSLLSNSPPGYSRVDRLFDSEEGSDVTFLVGSEPETWRFPGHRSVLTKANPVFKAMLAGPENTISIPDIESRAFDLLLRYLYNKDVHLQSVNTALCTFYAAQKYMCTGLMTECIAFLDRNLDIPNVLQVYQEMRVHSGQRVVSQRDPWAPSAPPYHQVCDGGGGSAQGKDPNDNFDSTLCLAASLVDNCLLYIDCHADRVLAEESLEDLTADALKEILERDTLYVFSEIAVYNGLERWVNRECKRRQMELSPESRRSVLGDELLFTPRYLLMTEREFFTGPGAGYLLDRGEIAFLMALLLGVPQPPSSPSPNLISPELLAILSRPRRRPTNNPHSIRSKDGYFICSNLTKQDNFKLKPKKQKKERRKTKESIDRKQSGRCTGSCVGDCILRALSCLFD